MATSTPAPESAVSPSAPLVDLLESYGIARDDPWDAVIFGDGSGSRWGQPCGFASVLIRRTEMQRHVFTGGFNNGTVNVAELMAYLPALLWYTTNIVEPERSSGVVRAHLVRVVTDSQYVASMASQKSSVFTKKNSILLGALRMVEAAGVRLEWHWDRRTGSDLNQLADILSKAARFDNSRDLASLAAQKTGKATGDRNPY